MSAVTLSERHVTFSSPVGHARQTVGATVVATLKRDTAYLINVVREPLLPVVMYLTMSIAYQAAGRETAGGANVPAFLLVGIIGMLTWQCSIWASGHSLEDERFEGTIASLFQSPASRAGVIAGYGLAGLIMLLPAAAVVGVLAVASGAEFEVASGWAVVAGLLALIVASVATGFALASLFMLTRRANLMANVIQHPAMLLCGFFVPREELPSWLMPLSNALPVSHALDAFRLATLDGATLGDVLRPVGLACAVAAAYVLIGTLGLRKVEYAAKRSGQLELF